MKFFVKVMLITVLFLCATQAAGAATVSGTVFEWYSLEPLDSVIVEINTQPEQRAVSVNGAYSFEVPAGDYTITAIYLKSGKLEYLADENISIAKEGNFKLDLILFPAFESIDSLDELINANQDVEMDENEFILPAENGKSDSALLFYAILPILLLIVLALVAFWFYLNNKNKTDKKQKPELSDLALGGLNQAKERPEESLKEAEESSKLQFDDSAREVLEILKRSGNRLTQKELREKMPLSEAKVSLIIAELENAGLVKKIKKGRGNIIVLKP